MPLGARDVLMVIRARDLASRHLRTVGSNMGKLNAQQALAAQKLMGISQALTTIGIGMAAVGGAGVFWMNSATDAAIKYNQEAALTLTQVDQTGAKLEDIKRIGKDVAAAIPAPFKEMQTALYDIFSSMDVGLGGAQVLLTEFSRASVAGQVGLQDAARGTIGILNAYKLGAEGVNRINDIMFQLVRKGVGTYGEFSSVIGMATPAAVRAGQTFEQLAGMMAFLTRNGLSASSASASAGRALENLANPTVVKNLEAIGVTVKDAHGEFLPMVDVVDQLAKVFADMTGPEKAAALQDLLKGAGNNVQARRFWNLATENADGLRSFTESMFGASGQMDKAYDIMFNQPQSQIQLLTNQYEILKTEVGDQLLPVKLKLAEAALKVLEAWNGLSEGTQNLIIKIAAFTSAFLLVFGIVLTVVGVFGMLIAAIAPLVGGIGAAILVITGIGAAIVALGVVIFLIIRNFDTLKEVASDVWHFIREQALKAWHMMQDFWDWLSSAGVDVWHAISSAAKTAWDALTDAWDDVVGAFKKGWGWLSRTLGPGISAVMDVVSKDVIPVFEEIGETLGAFFKYTKQGFELWWIGVKTAFKVVVDTITQLLVPSIQFMIYWFSLGFNVVVEVVKFAITFIRAYIEFGVGVIVAIWQNFGSIIWNVIKNAWAQVWNYIKTVISIISNMLQFFMNVFQGDWGEAWQNVKNILSAAWNGIKTAVKLAIDLLLIMVRDLPGKILSFLGDVGRLLWQKGKDVISGLWTGMQNVWDILLGWVRGLPGKITGLFNSAVSWLFSVGKDILQGLWDGMKAIWRDITGWFQGLADHLPGWIKGPLGMNSPSKVFIELGKNTMEGYRIGLERSWRDVEKLMGGMGSSLQSDFNVNGSMSASTSGYRPDDRPPSDGRGMYVAGDLVVREERVASDMDWWARTGTTGV